MSKDKISIFKIGRFVYSDVNKDYNIVVLGDVVVKRLFWRFYYVIADF